MALDRLTIRAKKSISDLFSLMSLQNEPSILSDHQKENEILDPKGPSISSMSVGSAAASIGNESPSEDSPSKRKGLMGSLRKQKLRSIGSLRSLRSPTKTKQTDIVVKPSVDVAATDRELAPPPNCQNLHTPNHPRNSSLALNFQESPPGQPIFDLSHKEYPSSGFSIRHSSPVPVPASDKQSLRSPVELSVIPNGTVPSSPAPIRKILDLDHTEDSPSRVFSSCRVPSMIMLKATAPVEKPLSDMLQAAADYYLVPATDAQGKPMSSESIAQTVELKQTNSNTEPWSAWPEYRRGLLDEFDEQSPPKSEVSVKAGNEKVDNEPGNIMDKQEDGADIRPNATALDLLRQKQRANIYRRADGKRQMQVRLTGSDVEKADDPDRQDKNEVVSAGRDEDFTAAEKIVSNLGVFVRDDEILVKAEGMELTPDEAHAAGRIPAYVDIDLEPTSPEELGKRGSSWGSHTGLYDGTGYGSGSTSRPMTAINVTEGDRESSMLLRTRANNLSTGTTSSDTREYKDYADFEDFLATRHVS
ncbi:hypothetical protein PTTW11_10700 [Pyrenophora teres f. teres]|uniref:Uncharacterized protein n=1 Tax=Pyrenophora teres f. teres TaxID=97479 RepID=A0A6S6WH03_9PLEO|nr:hypothetical protein PTNB29_08889 [Pyrenophora teres f. teres]CAE7215481.1 hypothetical protein PTTW11_10700 [Pyrenophora teres f. teres]